MGTKETAVPSHTVRDRTQNPHDNIQMHHGHGTKVLTGSNEHKKQHTGQYVIQQHWHHATHTKSQVPNLCSMVLQVFHTNGVEPVTKIHQRFTNPGHLQEEAKDTSILAGLQPKLTLLLKLNQ